MATVYCDDGGSNTSPYDTWAKAATTLQTALTAAGANGLVYMDQDHYESFAVNTTFTGSDGIKIIVCQTGTTTPVTSPKATPNIETTTGNDFLVFGFSAYMEGISTKSTDDFRPGNDGTTLRLVNSKVEVSQLNSSIGGVANDGNSMFFDECTIISGNIDISRGLRLHIVDSVVTLAATSAILGSIEGGQLDINGCDLSSGTFTYLMDTAIAASAENVDFFINNCKLPASVAYDNGLSPSADTSKIVVTKSGNADQIYQYYERQRYGTIQEETAIYRSGGASVPGTTGFSYKITTTASAVEYLHPVRFKLATLQVDATTEKTLTVHLAYNDPDLNNDDVWLEVRYPDATNEAHGQWASTGMDRYGDSPSRTAFTDVSGTETWNGTAKNNEETIEVAITGADGLVEVFICLAKASTTIYVDPKVEVS